MTAAHALLLALLILTSHHAAGAQHGYPRRFGKTNAQILAMGSDRWMDFQGKKAGTSTAAMTEGMSAYRDALRWRNDRLAPRKSPALRKRVEALRPLLEDYTDSMMEIGRYHTGGGTIWSNVHAAAWSDLEETFYHLLAESGSPPKPHTTGQVRRALNALQKPMDARAREEEVHAGEHQSALDSLRSGRETFARIVRIASAFNRRGSDHILAFTLAQAKTGLGEL